MNVALGWGPGGHMIVAQIAYSRLNHHAKGEVDKLIKLRIDPEAITANHHYYDHVHLLSQDPVSAGEWCQKEFGFPRTQKIYQ